jgi:hypothetical protein
MRRFIFAGIMALAACASEPPRSAPASSSGAWRVATLPEELAAFRTAMAKDPNLGLVVVQKRGEAWTLLENVAPRDLDTWKHTVLSEPVEVLGFDGRSQLIRLLVRDPWASINKARNGFLCNVGLGSQSRDKDGLTMCTSDLALRRDDTGSNVATTIFAVASLGTTIEVLKETDKTAILKIADEIDLSTRHQQIGIATRLVWAVGRSDSPTTQEWAAMSQAERQAYWDRMSKPGDRLLQNMAATQVERNALAGVRPAPVLPGPDLVGARICRDGQMTFQSCMNPAYPSSCFPKKVKGQLKAFVEGYSPDGTRLQIRIAGHGFYERNDYPMNSEPTLEGLTAQAGAVAWDEAANWYRCN